MRIDRTTMVALVDELERKRLLRRRADSADRRRNVITLTAAGRTTLRDAREIAEALERGALSEAEAGQLRGLLSKLAFPDA
jgi:DNA-binding MarR family transcriptional regulator